MFVSVHDEWLLGRSLCRYMAIGISIMAAYILGFYSLLDMKYVTVKVTHPAHPNETQWVSRLSSFYTDNKVVIDILYNHLLSLTIPCLSLVVVVVSTSITVGKLRATMAWRQETANKPSSGQAGSGSSGGSRAAAETVVVVLVAAAAVIVVVVVAIIVVETER